MHDVTVRRATPEDAEAIASLSGELGYPSTVAEIRPRLDVLLADPEHAVFVVEEDARVVGWLHAAAMLSLETGHFAQIRGLVVAETHRNRGLGAQLVSAFERWASSRGVPRLRVLCNVTRERTHRFYERLGYAARKSQKVFEKNTAAP